MQEQVTVGQVAQQAIERLQGRINELEEAARELLSYCEGQAQHSGSAVDESAYDDISRKLRDLLDGEQ